MINQDFLNKYVSKNAAEIAKSGNELRKYLADHGFSSQETEVIIEKGKRAIERQMRKDFAQKQAEFMAKERNSKSLTR